MALDGRFAADLSAHHALEGRHAQSVRNSLCDSIVSIGVQAQTHISERPQDDLALLPHGPAMAEKHSRREGKE
jgi:hypothetical protein